MVRESSRVVRFTHNSRTASTLHFLALFMIFRAWERYSRRHVVDPAGKRVKKTTLIRDECSVI